MKYFVTKAKAIVKGLPKLPTAVQLMGLFKGKKVTITKPQAEQVVDQLKIAEYDNMLAGRKSILGTPLVKKEPAPKVPVGTKSAEVKVPVITGQQVATGQGANQVVPEIKTETPVQAQQNLAPKRTGNHGY